MEHFRVNLYDLILCLSKAQDLISPELVNHHQQVAYLSYHLARYLKLDNSDVNHIVIAALMHDIGALSAAEKLEIVEKEVEGVDSHSARGAKLLEEFKPLQTEAEIIRYHHLPWDHGNGRYYEGKAVPYASQIINLSDSASVYIDTKRNVLSQIPYIISRVSEGRDSKFNPELIDALSILGQKDYIWLDLTSESPIDKIPAKNRDLVLEIDDVVEFSLILSHIIDFRSKFTSRHSAGVAKTAERLAELAGFSPNECKMMLIAGYLHDLGKLAIKDSILQKPGKLNDDEFNEIRSHTYYTYHLLNLVPQFETINKWASFHHEKLNGKGYPFHIKGDNLPLGSRIMAVADVFTAITENRPYRKGMKDENVINVLNNMVASGAVDAYIVTLLKDNMQEINRLREDSQHEASEKYDSFMKVAM